jgi:hypothetical protein
MRDRSRDSTGPPQQARCPDFPLFDNRTPLRGMLPSASAWQPYRQRGHAARHWTDMQSKIHYDHKKTQLLGQSASGASLPKSSPNWKPEPSGLSREELRKIVARIMG